MTGLRTLFKFWLYLALLLAAGLSHAADDFESMCAELLTSPYEVMVGEESITGSDDTFTFEDLQYGFVFEGYLASDGFLLIDAFLIDEERGIRSRQKGRHLFQRMIEHFGLNNIKGIRARWSSGVNFDAYMIGLKAGMSKEEAAFTTWTGGLAREYGFNKVGSVLKGKSPNGVVTHIIEFVRSEIPLRVIPDEFVVREKSARVFHTQAAGERFELYAELNRSNKLFISLITMDAAHGVRSATRGSELYAQMMEHFGPENIVSVLGNFYYGSNHEAYFSYKAQGYSQKEAAMMTWSGRQAAKYGFTRAMSVTETWSESEGYSGVEVEFGRGE